MYAIRSYYADEFTEKFVGHVRALRVGDPMDRETDIGPLAREDLVGDLERQVQESVALGARVAVGRITSYNVCYTKLLRLVK